MMKSSEVQIRLSSYPISHENVIIYSIQNINIKNYANLRILRNRIDTSIDLTILGKWYSKSLIFIPKKWKNSIRSKILYYLEQMTSDEEEVLLNWNMVPFLELDTTKQAHSKLTSSWQDL